MRSKARKNVHKRLKNKKSTDTLKSKNNAVMLKYDPVPHNTWVRPRYHESDRMYVLKLINEFGKTLIKMYRKDKSVLDSIYDKIV